MLFLPSVVAAFAWRQTRRGLGISLSSNIHISLSSSFFSSNLSHHLNYRVKGYFNTVFNVSMTSITQSWRIERTPQDIFLYGFDKGKGCHAAGERQHRWTSERTEISRHDPHGSFSVLQTIHGLWVILTKICVRNVCLRAAKHKLFKIYFLNYHSIANIRLYNWLS